MTFKVGDRVEFVEDYGFGADKGAQGVVTALVSGGTFVRVELDNGPTVEPFPHRLQKVEPAFTFADIQVGDKIRRTLTRDTGTTEVREGTVVEKSSLYALDAKRTGRVGDSYILAYDSDGDPAKPQVKLELLDRPKPKHWTETKPVGSVAIYLAGMFTKTFRKTGDDEWVVVYPEDGFTFESKNQGLMTRFAAWDESKLTWIK